jgi:IS1 family transposase/transposase-like protein
VIVACCEHKNRRTNGTTKAGAIRYRCRDCGKSWTESTAALGGMRIGLDRAERIISLLCEGMTVRGTARLTNTDLETVLDLLVMIGERCDAYMQENIKDVYVENIQCDEAWSFVLCKRATAKEQKYVGGCGDCYVYTAIERGSKLVVAWHMGKRNESHTDQFIGKLSKATKGRFHLSTDGWSPYPMAIWRHLEHRVDYGMLVKIFREGTAEDRRKYSPARIIGSKKQWIFGDVKEDQICTSHSERLNGSIRNFTKRMGRLTYAFSKKWDNHRCALALFFMHYNYCRTHKSLGRRTTPAMAHGLENHRWTVREMIEKVLAA